MSIFDLPPLTPSAAMRWDLVKRRLPAQPGEVLEIGCGQGAVAARLAPLATRFVGIEPDPASCSVAVQRVGTQGMILNIDSAALPAHERFDTLCSFEVLEHIEDDRAALEQWLNHLRPGGSLVLSVPAHRHRMGAADELVGHFRRYDPAEMRALLHKVGLTEIRVEQYGYPAGLLLEAGRNRVSARKLKQGARSQQFAARTAASGRFLQPGGGLSSVATRLISAPIAHLQRLFPDRGPGLVATARKAA